MSDLKFTPEQESAISSRSSSVLVSAAAGSGKTRVLTERLMAYVTDKKAPKDISSFLVITYTRAAAAELRARIMEELSLRASAEPENRRLRRQSTLCYGAQIGTIHSFCTSILREYCHKTGLSPDFRVGDEDRCALFREKALENILDEAYGRIGGDEDFASLVESVGAGRDDARLAKAVLDLHTKMQSHPYPAKWAAQQLSALAISGNGDAGDTVWGRELMDSAKRTVSYWFSSLGGIWRSLNADAQENLPLLSAYGDSMDTTMDALRRLLRSLDGSWDGAREALPIPFPRLKPLKNYAFDDRKAAFTAARDACRKAVDALCAVFEAPSEKLLGELLLTAPAMKALINLTLEFDRQYALLKRRNNLLDFSDLEHFAVALLCDGESGLPTAAAAEISERYTEIMVDEYQDVNAVQDLIFRCVSRNGNNLFMVGDVKQSIYRFRLADPSIFLSKYRSYRDYRLAEETEPKKILLQNNFRSDVKLLAACNRVFSNTMSEELGEICYDGDAALRAPENAAPPRGTVCLTVVAVPQAEDGEERPDKTALEARSVAAGIRALIDGGETILENGAERPVGYGDIAVLLRSPGSAGAAFAKALADRGIPVLSEQSGGFFTSPEIRIVISLLSVIDNPHRDVPLTAALTSPVFAFSADELSLIRTADRDGDFYSALVRSAAGSEKCAAFLATLSELRKLSLDVGIYALLCEIYDRLGLPALFSAMGGGNALPLLLDCAASFEENGYRGLYGFLKQLARMEARGEEPLSASGGTGSAVRILSIHKAKGLEFPVVFLANTSRRFNTADLRASVLIHPVLGLGCKVTDTRRGLEYPTLARRAIASRLTSELLSEEMRVLYVAMTRAKERLYLSCTAGDPEALIAKLSQNLTSPISPELLKSMPSMSHWLISAALCGGDGLIALKLEYPSENASPPEEAAENTSPGYPEPDISELEKLSARLNYTYPYGYSVALPTKLTATSLPGEESDAEAASLVKERRSAFRLPDFAAEGRPLTGAEAGTATHIVMQFIDFSRVGSPGEIESEVARIAGLGQLTERQAKAVDRASILRFFASDVGRRIKSADSVRRELRFSLLCPAEKFFAVPEGENVLLQGVVDCLIEENGALSVIDYKTDHVTLDTLAEASARYANQLRAYAYAMSRITKKPVCSCLLCFLRSGLFYEFAP